MGMTDSHQSLCSVFAPKSRFSRIVGIQVELELLRIHFSSENI